MEVFGLDATSWVPAGAQHAINSKFMIRYLSRYTPKVVTKAELAYANANGLGLGVVFEDSATNALLGYAQGKADAEWSRKQVYDILGPPANPNAIIPCAVDFDPAGREAQTDQYFEGVAAVINRHGTGPYGSYNMCAHSHARGFGGLFQTYAWSGGQFFDQSKWFQYSNDHVVGGVGCDFDKAFDLSSFWNHKVVPVDPYRYHIYDKTLRHLWIGHPAFSEFVVVQAYDKYRAMQTRVKHPHRQELDVLKHQCALLAERIRVLAMKDYVSPVWGTAEHWNIFDRRERYKGLYARGEGKLVVHL